MHTLVQYYYSGKGFWTDFFESQDDNFYGLEDPLYSLLYMPPLCSQWGIVSPSRVRFVYDLTSSLGNVKYGSVPCLCLSINCVYVTWGGWIWLYDVFVRNKINRKHYDMYSRIKLYKIRKTLLKVFLPWSLLVLFLWFFVQYTIYTDCAQKQANFWRWNLFCLKVVGNEKEGGPGKLQMIDIYLGLWWSMSICLCIKPPSCFKSISFSAYSSPIIKRWPTD